MCEEEGCSSHKGIPQVPLFSIYCLDNEIDGASRRAATRPEHLEWIKGQSDRACFVGPLLADDGVTMIGSNLLITADSLEEAKVFAAGDPYAKAGVFGSVRIHETKWILGGGKPE